MRLIVSGFENGRSCIVREEIFAEGEGTRATALLDLALAELPPRPPGRGRTSELSVPPGTMKWLRINFPPAADHGMHYTDTIDCHTIVSGSIELVLDDGAHALGPGDCAVVSGVDHAWRAGPDGCTSSVLILGTPPPEA